MFRVDRREVRHFDWLLFAAFIAIPLSSIVVLFSAGYDPETRASVLPWLSEYVASPPLVKQVAFFAAGLIAMGIGIALPHSVLHRYAYIIFGILLLSLVAVLLFGTVVNGSRRWIALGPINLQPAEPMKLATILALGRLLSRRPPQPGGYSLREILLPAAMLIVPMALIMKQPDLGTALALGGVGTCMLLFVGIQRRVLIGAVLVGAVLSYPAWHSLHDYQQKRVLMLFNPEADSRGSGYHIIQSIIAVGSGGIVGKGFMRGTQAQLEFLPEHSTDFIFSVLAEEWGFFGCVLVLVFYLFFLFRLLRVVARSGDLFGSLVAFGIASLIFLHVVVNVGMVIGLLPVVGIPLILFSYGGSSLISTMFSIGVAMGISMRRLSYTGVD